MYPFEEKINNITVLKFVFLQKIMRFTIYFNKNNITMKLKLSFTLLFVCVFILNNNYAQSGAPIYKKVEITINEESDIQKIAESGIDLRCGIHM